MNEIIIDCAGVTRPLQLHSALCEALLFPDWYGHNLDALFDCLTELEDEIHLILQHWDALDDWREGFEATFADAAEENPCFTYTLERGVL